MHKFLTPATAIALALGLQGCGTAPTFPKFEMDGAFSNPSYDAHADRASQQMALGDAALKAGDSATAVRIYRGLAREYPFQIAPRIKLGDALLASGAAQEAGRVYAGANKLNPTYEGLTGMGRVQLALRQPADALVEFNRAAKIRPGDAKAENGRAVALDQLGRHVDAQRAYLSLLDKDPSNLEVRSNYALSLALAGNYDDATDILRSLAKVPGADERIRQNLALVYGLAGNNGQAAHYGRMDLDEDAVNNNLRYYQSIRNLDAAAAKTAGLTHPSAQDPLSSEIGPYDAADAGTPHYAATTAPAPTVTARAKITADASSDAATVPAINSRDIETMKYHSAAKPEANVIAVRPVITASIQPAPANKSEPKVEEKAVAKAEPAKPAARHASHDSLLELPVTRAEASSKASTRQTADNSKTVEAKSAAPAKSADSLIDVAVANNAPFADDLKPLAQASGKAAHSHHNAAPAVPSTGVTGAVANGESLAAREALRRPAVEQTVAQSEPGHARTRISAIKAKAPANASPVDANPIDTGVRAPAVPAAL